MPHSSARVPDRLGILPAAANRALLRRRAFLLAAASCLLLTPALPARTVTIGSGSGYLNFPTAQQTLGLQPGDTLYINAGTYSGLSLGNLAGTTAAPITVRCDPNTVFTTSTYQDNEFPNISNINFQNFQYLNYGMGVMSITGASHDLTFQNYTITNANGYAFRIYDANKVFDGTKASTFYNFTWNNVTVDGKVNGAAISNSDYGSVSNLKSVALDFKVTNCTFKNFDNSTLAFSVLELSKCFGLEVSNSTFSNIGMAASPVGHNVCVAVSGYASVHNNNFSTQWADDVRCWPMQLNALGYNSATSVNRFYNNISSNSRKYAMFEQNGISSADFANSQGYLSPTASEVFFNTVYKSHKADYVAPLVDIYGPNVSIAHNLIIDPECDAPFNPAHNYVYSLGAGSQSGIVVSNNLVYGTLADSGLVDEQGFLPSSTSPVLDAATGTVPYITTDYYGNPRYVGAAADVGAVERPVPEPSALGLLAAGAMATFLRRRR